jgi:AraC-like DNA-binding protein
MPSLLSLRHYSHELLNHSHAHAQLVFGLSGQLDFEVAGLGSQVIRQSLAVVPAAAQHACGSSSGSQCLVLDVPSEYWLHQHLGIHADASRRLLDRPGARCLNPAQSQLVSWLAASPINDPVIAQQGAALLLASLASEGIELARVRGLPLAALDAHIDRHAAYPLQVGDLARLAGLSAARFHTRFLDETGQTPMAYVRSRRLHLAHQLLCTSQLAVGEIAARVGYSSQSAFTAALLRQFGCTPRALRQRHD